MSKLFHLKPKDFVRLPWKNGLGETIELAKDSDEPFNWRISRATLEQSGPFSNFPHYDRHLIVIHGPKIILSHSDGMKRHVSPLEEIGRAHV